jgi:3-dehydroquinate dehydratase II
MHTKTPYTFLVLNGPNLGHIGERQPEIYGNQTLKDIPGLVSRLLGPKAEAIRLEFYQSNSEGALIDRLEAARASGIHGVAFNAGAYTHTSLAIADCVAWIGLPVVEVHISNVHARQEEIRKRSYLAAKALGCISGFGLMGYALAVQALYMHVSGE